MEEIIRMEDIILETDLPVIARFDDDLFPYQGFDHVRQTARALAENEEGKFGFLHIVGEDFFGVRDHLETCGGRIEENEGIVDALKREIDEEMGLTMENYEVVGCILDAYNLIGRITVSSFLHVKLDTLKRKTMHRTEEEQILINEIVWLDPLEALDRLEHDYHSKVDLIVQRRDAAALRYYLTNKGIIKNNG